MSNTQESFNLSETDKEIIETIRRHFEPSYYLSKNPDVAESGIDPLIHYMMFGWREGRDPNPNFSTQFYLLNNTDVAETGVNPFWHYIVTGIAEGRTPQRPKTVVQNNEEMEDHSVAAIQTIRPHFDASYYLQTNPDVAKAGLDPLIHYYDHGWRENRDPTPDFSVLGYLSDNPDVAAAEIDPFWHYHSAGKAEGRVPRKPATQAFQEPTDSADQELATNRIAEEIATIRDAFDTEFYLRQNPDIAEAGIDPIKHFVVSGWKEGRDPNQSFSVTYYLETNPDIGELDLNPFWHYIVAGRDEGRIAKHPGGYRVETLLHTQPLEETVKALRTCEPPETVLSADDLCTRIRGAAVGRGVKLMLSVGHDNYREISGGVQFCIQQEEEIARGRGVLYLNLHPHQPLPRLAHSSETPDTLVVLQLSGAKIGTAPLSAVTEAVSTLADDFEEVEVVVHHLMGHSPEQVADLVRATGSNRCWLWLHDFFTLCPSYALQRNNVSFCGAPPHSSNSCRLCLFGEERITHRARMSAFFERLSVQVIAPSQFTADYWTRRSALLSASLTVREHMVIDWSTHPERAQKSNRPITVAFIGYPGLHKGWPMFERIVREERKENQRYRFIYFGTSRIALDKVENVTVHVTAEDPDAMIRALAEHEVDIVLHWASCAETFSFSTHEALAAGAFVLTNPLSGNVAVTVRQHGQGAVLMDETDLEAFFRDGRAVALAAEAREWRRTHKATLTRSEQTFAVLDQEQRL